MSPEDHNAGAPNADSDGTERPDCDGIMTVSPDEGEEGWVHTARILGDTKGEKIDKYAKVRVVETRKIRTVDADTDRDGGGSE